MCFLEWKTWNFTDRLSLKSNLIRSIGSYFIKRVFLLNCSCILVSILEWFSWNLYRLITETCSVVTITNYKKNNNLIEFGSRLKVYWICKNRFFLFKNFPQYERLLYFWEMCIKNLSNMQLLEAFAGYVRVFLSIGGVRSLGFGTGNACPIAWAKHFPVPNFGDSYCLLNSG